MREKLQESYTKSNTYSRASRVLIAIGANLPTAAGDPVETVLSATRKLAELTATEIRLSPLYRTPAFPLGAGPDYINGCMALSSALAPTKLMEFLHSIEAEHGRERQERWASRTLDLDLIAVDALVLPDAQALDRARAMPVADWAGNWPDTLFLPHPRMEERGFVLLPLADIAPDWRHPQSGRSVAELAAALPPEAVADITRISTHAAPQVITPAHAGIGNFPPGQ